LNQRTCWGQFYTSETLLILLDSWVLRKSGTSRTSRQGQKCLWGVDVWFNSFLEGERMMIDSHIWGAKTSSPQSEAWWFPPPGLSSARKKCKSWRGSISL
jgi:hypothetical protein